MIVLIDSDIVCYRCAASANNDPVEVAVTRIDELMNRILYECNSDQYESYIGGQDNFRYKIYPEYKANRRDTPKPIWLDQCREHVVKYWKGQIVNGMEADDALGIQQTKYQLDSIIASIDKDLLSIPGHHFNFVKSETKFVSPFDGLRTFYKQLILGDGSDHIPGYDGKFRQKSPLFIQALQEPIDGMTEETEMYKYVTTLFDDIDIMHRNAQLLYILKEEGIFWTPPNLTDNGQQEDSIHLL